MDMDVRITDITGRVLRAEAVQGSVHSMEVSNLPSGVYLLRMETPQGACGTGQVVKR